MSEMPLVQTLQTAAGLLEGNEELRQQVLMGCDRISNPSTRIAVFGPFNLANPLSSMLYWETGYCRWI